MLDFNHGFKICWSFLSLRVNNIQKSAYKTIPDFSYFYHIPDFLFFNVSMIFLFYFLLLVWDSVFSLLLIKIWMGIDGVLCCICEIIGLFFSFFFLPQRQYCFIYGPFTGVVAPCPSCMRLFCLSIGYLVGFEMSHLLVPHFVRNHMPPSFAKIKYFYHLQFLVNMLFILLIV